MVSAGGSKHALVIGADVMSSIIDYTDRTTCVLFGDGAGAVVVEASDDDDVGIIDFENYVDGSGGDALCMPAGGSLRPASHDTVDEAPALRQAGRRRRSSSSPCATRKRSAAGFSIATASIRARSTSSLRIRRTGASSSLDRREAGYAARRRSSSTSSGSATPPAARFRWC